MLTWIVAVAEPLPIIDGSYRDFRCGFLAKAMIDRGHEVVWWTSNFDHMSKRRRFSGPKSIGIEPRLTIHLLDGPEYAKNVSLRRVWHNRVVSAAFERATRAFESKPDVVFACMPTLELAQKAVAYGTARRIPVVVDVRDQWPDLYLSAIPPSLRRLARLALSFEFRRAKRTIEQAAAITAVSHTYLDWALKYAGRSAKDLDGVFPLGYPVMRHERASEIEERARELKKEYGIRSEGLVVTFVGTFGMSYDLDTVVNAARILSSDRATTPVQIVLAGDGDRGSQLRESARSLDNIVFTGWLNELSVQALLHISSVGLAAYNSRAMQSLPNKPFEYWAAGLPTLSSLEGELRTLIDKEGIGLYYRPEDVLSLVERIRWLRDNDSARIEMGTKARILLERDMSAEAIYSKLAAHLERVSYRRVRNC